MSGNDILSQEEIDALLQGMDSGDVEVEMDTSAAAGDEAVRAWDFSKEERIVRGRMPALEMINERFARFLRLNLHNHLRRNLEVTADGVKMQKFADYSQALFVPASLSLLKLEPLRGQGLLVLDPKLVFLLVDHFFGGDGRFHSKVEGREFTPTELRVVQIIVERALKEYGEAWESVMEVEPRMLGHEVVPQMANVVTRNEVVVVSSFRVDFDNGGGALHLTLPYAMLEPVRRLLDSGIQGERHEHDESWKRLLRQEVLQASIELVASLGEVQIPLRKLAALKVGDVLPIESPESVTLCADDIPVMHGRFGARGGNAAVKVDRLIPIEALRQVNAGRRTA